MFLYFAFSLDRDENVIKNETIGDMIAIHQMQDRAKLLLVYNKELNQRCEKLQTGRNKRKDEDMEAIRRQTGINDRNNDLIEGLKKKTKDLKAKIKEANDQYNNELKELNTE